MVKLNVKIVSMQDADKFNKICSKFDCDMDLQSGKYYVDAKSIMGIFSLDLSHPLVLNADTDDEQKGEKHLRNLFKKHNCQTKTDYCHNPMRPGNHSGAFAALRKECRLNFVLLCLYGLTFFTECAQ